VPTLLTIPNTEREVDLEVQPLRSLANIAWYDWSQGKTGVGFAAKAMAARIAKANAQA
jgi:hypothetical protein